MYICMCIETAIPLFQKPALREPRRGTGVADAMPELRLHGCKVAADTLATSDTHVHICPYTYIHIYICYMYVYVYIYTYIYRRLFGVHVSGFMHILGTGDPRRAVAMSSLSGFVDLAGRSL